MVFFDRFRRRREVLSPYTHIDSETGEQLTSPFKVAVTSADGRQFLGTGEVVGVGARLGSVPVPTIVIVDPSTGTSVRIMGHECWWTPKGIEELEALIAEGEVQPESPAKYRAEIDSNVAAADRCDSDFFKSSGIDPGGEYTT